MTWRWRISLAESKEFDFVTSLVRRKHGVMSLGGGCARQIPTPGEQAIEEAASDGWNGTMEGLRYTEETNNDRERISRVEGRRRRRGWLGSFAVDRARLAAMEGDTLRGLARFAAELRMRAEKDRDRATGDVRRRCDGSRADDSPLRSSF
nr:unnamed protein product [Digitaria exilis]